MDLITFIKKLYAIDTVEGCTEEELKRLKVTYPVLPARLEEFYRMVGHTSEIQVVQDTWIMPEQYETWTWLKEYDSHFILLNENQGVCQAGIRLEDMTLPDPPVYVSMDDQEWELCAPTLSEFLMATLAYESVFTFEYSPEEFFWLSEEELELLESRLDKLPFTMHNWMNADITCYQNAPDNLAVIMDCEGDYQLLYGGATEESFHKLQAALEDLGEPI